MPEFCAADTQMFPVGHFEGRIQCSVCETQILTVNGFSRAKRPKLRVEWEGSGGQSEGLQRFDSREDAPVCATLTVHSALPPCGVGCHHWCQMLLYELQHQVARSCAHAAILTRLGVFDGELWAPLPPAPPLGKKRYCWAGRGRFLPPPAHINSGFLQECQWSRVPLTAKKTKTKPLHARILRQRSAGPPSLPRAGNLPAPPLGKKRHCRAGRGRFVSGDQRADLPRVTGARGPRGGSRRIHHANMTLNAQSARRYRPPGGVIYPRRVFIHSARRGVGDAGLSRGDPGRDAQRWLTASVVMTTCAEIRLQGRGDKWICGRNHRIT